MNGWDKFYLCSWRCHSYHILPGWPISWCCNTSTVSASPRLGSIRIRWSCYAVSSVFDMLNCCNCKSASSRWFTICDGRFFRESLRFVCRFTSLAYSIFQWCRRLYRWNTGGNFITPTGFVLLLIASCIWAFGWFTTDWTAAIIVIDHPVEFVVMGSWSNW